VEFVEKNQPHRGGGIEKLRDSSLTLRLTLSVLK